MPEPRLAPRPVLTPSLRRACAQTRLVCLALAAMTFLSLSSAVAQTAHFAATESPLTSTSLSNPVVTSDQNGTVYIADSGNNRVLKETPSSSGGYVETTVPTGSLNGPLGIAVDAAGNLFVADTRNNRVLEEQVAGAGYTESVVSAGSLSAPEGLAVDTHGNLYIADSGNNRVLKVTMAGGAQIVTTVPSSNLKWPAGVAVDAAGNVFIVDTGNNRIKMEPPGGTRTSEVLIITNGLYIPRSVAVDSSDNLYVLNSGLNQLLKDTLVNGRYTLGVVTSYLLGNPTSVSLDAAGDLFLADGDSNQVFVLKQQAADFGRVAVGSASTAQLALFTFDTQGRLGAAPVVTTQGQSKLDFTQAPGDVCNTSHFYYAGDTCAVRVKFSPAWTGPRYGAATLLDCNNGVLATAYLRGTGTGPQVNFSPGSQTVVVAGLSNPRALAVDGAGSVYIADTDNMRVLKETFSGGTYTQGTIPSSALMWPLGVAVDGAGNVYISDTWHSREIKETLANGSYTESVIVSKGLNYPSGIAVDANGVFYLADDENNRVLVETPSGTAYVASVPPLSGLHWIKDVVVDADGNLYIADTGNNRIVKETLSGGVYTPVVIPTSTLNFPRTVAVDAGGNVYIADTNNDRVLKETLVGGAYVESTVGSGLSSPNSVAVDSSGNVYIADTGHGRVVKVDYADAPALSFASTKLGAESDVQTVVVTNVGNDTLTFPVPSSGNSPALTAGFSLDSSAAGACPQSAAGQAEGPGLAPGASCSLALTFAPTDLGSVAGNLVLSDNNLNVAGAMQALSLGGTGIAGKLTMSLSAPASAMYGDAVLVNASIDGASATKSSAASIASVTAGSVLFADQHGSFGTQSLQAGSAQQSYLASGVGSFTLTAAYTPASSILSRMSAQASIQILAAPLSIAANDATRIYGAANPQFAGSVSGAVSGDSFVETFRTSATQSSPVGTYSISPSVSGNNLSNYRQDIKVGTLQVLAAGLTASANNASRAYGSPNPAFTGSVTGLVSGDAVTATYTTTATAASKVGSYAIVPALSGASLANYNPTIRSGVLTVSPGMLSVSANDATRMYGSANPTLAGSLTGLVSGDAVTATYTTTATAASKVGSYAIVPALSGASLANYNPTIHNGVLTVSPAPLTLSANNATRVYGAPNPPFTGSLQGVVNGDVLAESFTTLATPASSIGEYSVVPGVGGEASANYAPTATNGVLTVTPAPLRVVARNATRVYGAANPAFTGTSVGALNGDSIDVSYTTTASVGDAPGVYSINAVVGGAAARNYAVQSSNGVLTISKAASSTVLGQSASISGDGSLALVAKVSAGASIGNATGSVQFLSGQSLLAQATLEGGVATYQMKLSPAVDTNALVAVYQGDANFLPSSSNVLPIHLDTSGFWIKPMPGGTGLSVVNGGMAVLPFLVGPGDAGVYPGTVSFAVAGLPQGAVAVFSPATLTADAGQQNVSLSVQMPQLPAAKGNDTAGGTWLRAGAGGAVLALCLLPLGAARRMRSAGNNVALLLLLMFGALAGSSLLVGCGFTPGTRVGADKPDPDAKPITYALTVTMSSGGTQRVATASLSTAR